jgi:hypothetical protein
MSSRGTPMQRLMKLCRLGRALLTALLRLRSLITNSLK